MENRIFTLADSLKEAKDKKKKLEAEVKELTSEIEQLDRDLSDAMAEEEVEKFSRNGSTFYLSTRLYASPLAGQKEALFQALRENGFGELITETVNAQTLSSFVKEQTKENGEVVPEWIAQVTNVFEKVSVGIRKA